MNDLSDSFGIKFYDYSGDVRFNDSDFYDSEHLNANGAKKISSIINNEIIC